MKKQPKKYEENENVEYSRKEISQWIKIFLDFIMFIIFKANIFV